MIIKSFKDLTRAEKDKEFLDFLKGDKETRKNLLEQYGIKYLGEYKAVYSGQQRRARIEGIKNPFTGGDLYAQIIKPTSKLKNKTKLIVQLTAKTYKDGKNYSKEYIFGCKVKEVYEEIKIVKKETTEKKKNTKEQLETKDITHKTKQPEEAKTKNNLYKEKSTKYNLTFEYVDKYYPVRYEKRNRVSELIIDMKNGHISAMKEIADMIKDDIPDRACICVIPPSKTDRSSMLKRALNLIEKEKSLQVTDFLKRVKDKEPYHAGAERNPENEFKTIQCVKTNMLKGKDVILIDDVCTSGSTMYACKKILMDNGARTVRCIAIGRTV